MRNLNTSEIKKVSGGLIIGPFGFYLRVIAATSSSKKPAKQSGEPNGGGSW